MAIKFLSGQTITGSITVSANVQAATFNSLAINTTGVNNVANQIVRTESNGYANFGWINSVSGNHTGSITRITASNDAYLRYVTPAQFRTGVTDGFYAPSSTVSGVTSVATGNGLTGGAIISTGTLSMSGSYTGNYTNNGLVTITYTGDSQSVNEYLWYNGAYGTFALGGGGSSVVNKRLHVDGGMTVGTNYDATAVASNSLNVQGSITSAGIIYASGGNSNTWNTHTTNTGTVTSVATGTGLTGGTITTTGTLSVDTSVVRVGITNTPANTKFASSSTATGYSVASIELRESNYSGAAGTPPFLGFHWSGVVASNISIESSGRIAILNNPGTSYEAFIAGTITAASSFQGNLTGNVTGNVTGSSGSTTGNAATSTTFSTGRGNYKGVTDSAVIGQMMWKNYGNNHTIFDASASTSPSGTSVNNTNSGTAWSATYPTLMGWNGANTYGVRVDSARIADSAANQGNYLPLVGGNMSGNITVNSGIGMRYSSTHWIRPRDAGGNMHLYASSGGIYIDCDTINFRMAGGTLGATYASGIMQANASMRAPIFYDSNNTAYYGDFATTSNINLLQTAGAVVIGGNFSNNPYNSTTGSRLLFGGGVSTNEINYYIGTNMENYGGNYNKLDIAFHTGIRMGARSSYGGIRFYENELLGTEIFAIGKSGNYVQAAYSLRAPIFYDSTNTTYYTRPATSSNINSLYTAGLVQVGSGGSGNLYIGNSGSTQKLRFSIASGSTSYFDMDGGDIHWRQNNGVSTRYWFYMTTANMTISGTLTQLSDLRLKENIVEIGDCISKVKAMRGIYYNRTDFNTEVTKVGVIAQEVEKVLPELVLHNEEGQKSVAYAELSAVLINAIKEQQVMIDDLKSRLQILENN